MSYQYRHVDVVRVLDGDTVRLDIDVGNGMHWADNFRLNGIDTPEKKDPGYLEAGEFLGVMLGGGLSRVETHKPDKFGRWLVDLWVAADGGELHVNTLMIARGFAKEYHGGKKT